jgi:hypothetical protein
MAEKPKDLKLDITQLTGMPLDEARAVIWPFKGIRKPIGILLEQGDITVRDIAWASENAYDPRLKQATQTILVSRLLPENLQPSLSPAQIIQGPSYTSSQRRTAIENKSLAFGIIFGIGAVFISVYAISSLAKQVEIYKEVILNVYGILFFLLFPLFLIWVGSKYADESELEKRRKTNLSMHYMLYCMSRGQWSTTLCFQRRSGETLILLLWVSEGFGLLK